MDNIVQHGRFENPFSHYHFATENDVQVTSLSAHIADLILQGQYSVVVHCDSNNNEHLSLHYNYRLLVRAILHVLDALHSYGDSLNRFSASEFGIYDGGIVKLSRQDMKLFKGRCNEDDINQDFKNARTVIEYIVTSGFTQQFVSYRMDQFPAMYDLLTTLDIDGQRGMRNILIHHLAVLGHSEIFKFFWEACTHSKNPTMMPHMPFSRVMDTIGNTLNSINPPQNSWLINVPPLLQSIPGYMTPYSKHTKPADAGWNFIKLLRNCSVHFYETPSITGNAYWVEAMLMSSLGLEAVRVQEVLHTSTSITFAYSKLMHPC